MCSPVPNALAVAALAVVLSGGDARGRAGARSIDASADHAIAYAAGDEIRVMGADGTGARTITKGRSPSWSPDGRLIAFGSESDEVPLNGPDIYLVNADGSDRRRIVTHVSDSDDRGNDRQPAFAPNSYTIAFTTDRTGNDDIWVTNSIGHATGPLTAAPGSDHSPAWSPDAERLAFVSDRDGNEEIYVLSLDGSSARRLTHDPAADRAPSWSPDASRIAFASDRGGSFDVYVMNSDGTGVRRLSGDAGIETNPAWSPDGESLVYTSARAAGAGLYVMPATGGVARPLTDPAEIADSAAWRPGVDLSVSVRAPAAVPRARPASVALAITNRSPTPAHRVVLVASAPAGARLVSVRAPAARCAGSREPTCRFSLLGPRAVASVRLTWRASSCGTFALQVSVRSLQSDFDVTNNARRGAVRIRC